MELLKATLDIWPLWATLLIVLAVYVCLVEPFWFRVRRIQLPIAHFGAPRFTVLHLSDFHFHGNERRRVRFLQSLKKLNADFVAYTGDLIEAHGRRETLWEAVEGLVGRYGSFVVFGNHDHVRYGFRELFYSPSKSGHEGLRWADTDSLADGFRERGIQPLLNAHQIIDIAGQPLLVVGIDDPYVHRDDVSAAFEGTPEGLPTVVLCHTPEPDVIERIAERGAHLILSGHTHGGQIRAPFNYAPVRRCGIPRRKCRGLSRWGNAWLNVSAGLGVTQITHMRFLCRPEAILLEITPSDGQGEQPN